MYVRDQHQHKHQRHDFLIERIAFFSDAVFAIAITLMIIDIHPPLVHKGDTDAMVWQKIREKLPEFVGLIISFWLIGSAWLSHHQLFRYIDKYDMGLLVINLCLLFTIILYPFSTSFLFNSIFDNVATKPQAFIYLLVPLCSNFVLYTMYKRAHKKYLEVSADDAFHNATTKQGFMALSFAMTLSWVVILPTRYHPYGYIFLVLGPWMSHLYKKYKKR